MTLEEVDQVRKIMADAVAPLSDAVQALANRVETLAVVVERLTLPEAGKPMSAYNADLKVVDWDTPPTPLADLLSWRDKLKGCSRKINAEDFDRTLDDIREGLHDTAVLSADVQADLEAAAERLQRQVASGNEARRDVTSFNETVCLTICRKQGHDMRGLTHAGFKRCLVCGLIQEPHKPAVPTVEKPPLCGEQGCHWVQMGGDNDHKARCPFCGNEKEIDSTINLAVGLVVDEM